MAKSMTAREAAQRYGKDRRTIRRRPHGIGFVVVRVCAHRDFASCGRRDRRYRDSTTMEGWLLSKADRAFRAQISQAVLAGDGFGKPMGILNPAAGIPIYETADAPSPGQFTWQDLVALRWQIPQSFQGAGAYMMK